MNVQFPNEFHDPEALSFDAFKSAVRKMGPEWCDDSKTIFYQYTNWFQGEITFSAVHGKGGPAEHFKSISVTKRDPDSKKYPYLKFAPIVYCCWDPEFKTIDRGYFTRDFGRC